MSSLWRRLSADQRGVSAIEFAMIGPVVLLTIATVIECGFLWSGATALEAGGRAAARYGLTGGEVDGSTRTGTIRRIVTEHVCPEALGEGRTTCFWASDGPTYEDEDGSRTPLFIDLTAYRDPRNLGRPEPFSDVAPANGFRDPGEEFVDINGNGRWDADTGVSGPGGPADIVVYELAMHQRVTNPLLRAVVGETLRHETRVVIRNEPF
jgi:hypothetical protein